MAVCDRDCDLALRGLRAVSGPLGILFVIDNFLKVLLFPFVCMCSADPLFAWIKLKREDRRMAEIKREDRRMAEIVDLILYIYSSCNLEIVSSPRMRTCALVRLLHHTYWYS